MGRVGRAGTPRSALGAMRTATFSPYRGIAVSRYRRLVVSSSRSDACAIALSPRRRHALALLRPRILHVLSVDRYVGVGPARSRASEQNVTASRNGLSAIALSTYLHAYIASWFRGAHIYRYPHSNVHAKHCLRNISRMI